MTSLKTNKAWHLVPLPPNSKALKNHWVYKVKEEYGNRKMYHAWLVVKGYVQQKGLDFEDIFSPFVQMTTIQVVLGLVAIWDLELEKLDVKMTFLHGDINEELYMAKGFVQRSKEYLYFQLKCSLYGLKQAPRQWYIKFDQFVPKHNFTQCELDLCIYYKRLPNGEFVILLLYVDDMLVASSS